jgi:hypothetical protein
MRRFAKAMTPYLLFIVVPIAHTLLLCVIVAPLVLMAWVFDLAEDTMIPGLVIGVGLGGFWLIGLIRERRAAHSPLPTKHCAASS